MLSFDLETTGTDKDTCRITQVGIVIDQTTSYNWLVNPGIPIPANVSALTGITDETVKDCPTFSQIGLKIASIMALEKVIVGFNCLAYDIPVLDRHFDDCGILFDWTKKEIIDVGNLYKICKPRTLSSAVQEYLNREHVHGHTADADAMATLQVLLSMAGRHGFDDKPTGEVAEMSNHGKRFADPAGMLQWGEGGQLLFAFGKNNGKPVGADPGYLRWMRGQGFPRSTMQMIENSLKSC